MEHLKMHTPNMADENFRKLAEMFPNAVTETITGYDENGKAIVERAIDADVLRQEISTAVVEGPQQRYQFTWPDKRKSVVLANQSIDNTLRLDRAKSVGRDGTPGSIDTENIYIEGDNLEALKLLHETYLGKVKMIYIDPPYNTGNDFIYKDDFSQSEEEYIAQTDQLDDEGNRLVQNKESNGRFHTNWLNMLYPRLKIARDYLSDDGAVFIHIDEHEVYTMHMICNEIFGEKNELGTIVWDKRNPKGVVAGVAYQHESILVYCKNITVFAGTPFTKKKEHAEEMIAKVDSLIKKYGSVNEKVRSAFKEYIKKNKIDFSGGESAYSLIDEMGRIYQPVSMAAPDKPETRSHRPLIHPITGKPCPVPEKGWRFTDKKMDELVAADKIEYGSDETTQPRQKYFLVDNMKEAVSSLLYYGGSDDALCLPFDNPKPVYVAKKIISFLAKKDGEIVMDFFSGSATTAHAVMQLNAEDGGNRKFILVQLPEVTSEKSEARKAGYSTICEIGEERIRRAGKKIKEDSPLTTGDLDIGFRVFRVDSSNMTDVYYRAQDYTQEQMDLFAENIKPDRTPEDLLFQVMLDLGIPLSSEIEETEIDGKKVFIVGGKYEDLDGIIRTHLVACFDSNVTDNTVTEIAKLHPSYAVFRDSGMANDSVMTNFEQIFESYSPRTERRVL
jgi:Adenine specific DNA methylase Mod